MPGALERIVRSGLAYQAAAFLSAGLGIFTFAAYTSAIDESTLGVADLILAWLIFLAIIARLGFGEALLRHWFTAGDRERPQLQRSIQGTVAATSLLAAVVVIALAEPIATLLPSVKDPWLIRIAGAGLFLYCNLDMAQTLLRARDDRRTYLVATVSNVLLTIGLSLLLVIVLDQGVRGYLIGNYAASGVVLAVLWLREVPVFARRVEAIQAFVHPESSLVVSHAKASGDARRADNAADDTRRTAGSSDADADAIDGEPVSPASPNAPDPAAALAEGIDPGSAVESEEQRRAASRGDRRALLRFGLPTIPTDAAIFGFNLFDRTLLAALAAPVVIGSGQPSALGVFSFASKIASGVILMARAFQLAFPPLAYSITDPKQASAIYASALRGYAVVLGATVAGVALCAPWTVEVLVHFPEGAPNPRPEVIEILPMLAAAWAMWGVIPVMTTIAGRLGAPKLAIPASLIGLAVNIIALLILVPPYGAHGAAAALVIAYVVLIASLSLFTHKYFPVAYDWPRIGAALALCIGTALLAGPVADAPDLGWTPAAIRIAMFATLIVLLWRLALEDAERAEMRGIGRRIARLGR
ncbi:MAG: polysaccharide biosynthesis C-terminal domain-containing protein [Solirubrobacteraceae bacterium]|nr:polysaccharide biosynthesis C-terminal domain-containing protein [Solirubrobacteraceae bacterium]